jgi:hypothetical protein
MSFLQFDLDAIPKVPKVARYHQVAEGVIAWGLLQLWELCWRDKTNVVTAAHLKGCFGVDATEGLLAFGFLRPEADGFWVKGSEKYLRIRKGQSEGGHAAKANLIPGAVHLPKPAEAMAPSPSAPAEGEPKDFEEVVRLPMGSTASSEQRAANSEQRREGEKAKSPPFSAPPATSAAPPVRQTGLGSKGLRDMMDAAWLQKHGTPYVWAFAEEQAMRPLLQRGNETEVLRRWVRALDWPGWPHCGAVKDLVQHWNRYGAEPPKPPPTKGRAPESDKHGMEPIRLTADGQVDL